MRTNEHGDKADAFWGEVLENDQVATEICYQHTCSMDRGCCSKLWILIYAKIRRILF